MVGHEWFIVYLPRYSRIRDTELAAEANAPNVVLRLVVVLPQGVMGIGGILPLLQVVLHTKGQVSKLKRVELLKTFSGPHQSGEPHRFSYAIRHRPLIT